MHKLEQHKLKQMQARLIGIINDGPDRLDPHMFSGDPHRILLGLKAHANTINHARLVALEQTFPRLCNAMGARDFNRISRLFCDTAQARRCSNNQIGAGFAAYLITQNVATDYADLARIEWATLESYHAADAPAIILDTLAMYSKAALLTQRVTCHPAAQLVMLNSPDFGLIAELKPMAGKAAILITRPETEVKIFAIDAVTAALFDAAQTKCTVGDLLQIATTYNMYAGALDAVMCLISAGALRVSNSRG